MKVSESIADKVQSTIPIGLQIQGAHLYDKTRRWVTGTNGKKNAGFHKEAIAYAEQIKVTANHDFNQEDGFFDQYASYMTCGFLMIKNSFGNELDGK